MPIVHLTYDQIDKKKWDDCIAHAANSLIYARSVYLDQMSPGWNALVMDDYSMVMPLAAKKKYGVTYLYQPAFIQQGGIYGGMTPDAATCNAFLEKLMQQYRFAEIPLNYANQALALPPGCIITQRNNYVLSLEPAYEQLYDNYQPSFTKSLRRLKKFRIRYACSNNIDAAISLYESLYSRRLPYFTQQDFSNFKTLCSKLAAGDKLLCREAWSSENKLLAAVVLINDGHRLYNIISAITAEGKKLETNYFLYDKMIEEFAGSSLLLDLEGSDVPGIADFYKKFSPTNQHYPHIRFNKLPALLRLFKR